MMVSEHDHNILIISQHETLLEDLHNALSAAGFVPHQAKTGAEGIKMLDEFQPAAILLGLSIEDMKPSDALRQIRAAKEWAPRVPVVHLIDTKTTEETVEDIKACEDDCIFIKTDWYTDHIVAKIKEIVGIKE